MPCFEVIDVCSMKLSATSFGWLIPPYMYYIPWLIHTVHLL